MKNNKVNLFGDEYKIIISAQKDMQRLYDSTGEVCGLCDYRTKTIYIDEEVAKDKYSFNTTLRHEIVHAMFESCGLSSQVPWVKEEALVDWIALQYPKMKRIFTDLKIEE